MFDVLSKINWSPLFISLKTGFVAIIFIFILGVIGAIAVMKIDNRAKWIIDAVFTMPLVLPPTVAGYLLLLVFSLRRPFGIFLKNELGIKVIQSLSGCVIAAVVISFPLMYRSARAAFEQIDSNIIYAGRTLGMSEFEIITKVVIPTAMPGLLSGGILSFARAIGEYGATAMLAGNVLGKTRTISVAIASEVAGGNFDIAGIWTCVIVLIAFVIVLAINLITGKGMKNVSRWTK
ncbi:MAG: molybdate ABC transporter permease subunit [Muribaculaceae bacterium]